MATKTITITEEAYGCLLKEKMSGESFTDTIKRLTTRGRLSDCFGLWRGDEKELKDIVNIIASTWKASWSKGADP
jgi:predicted CopG family antitoxin